MEQEERLFIVAKIDKVKNPKDFGSGRVFLFNRMLRRKERRYLNDAVTTKALDGVQAWELNVGDAITCIPSGSIEKDIPKHLQHLKKFKGMKTTTLNFWLPIRMYPSLRNLIIAKNGLAKDGSLLDISYSSAKAQLGEEWECMPIAISKDNQIIWYPMKRISKITTNLEEDEDGKILYCVQEVTGDTILSKVLVDPEVIHTHPREGIERIEYLFPIDRYDEVELDDGSVLKKEQIPSLAGVLVIEKKLTKEKEDAITKYSFMDGDPNAGYYNLMDEEIVDSGEIRRAIA